MNDTEVEHVCESVREIHKESKIKVCVSGGLLNETQFRKLKQAGITRVHNNLETSRQDVYKRQGGTVCSEKTGKGTVYEHKRIWKPKQNKIHAFVKGIDCKSNVEFFFFGISIRYCTTPPMVRPKNSAMENKE